MKTLGYIPIKGMRSYWMKRILAYIIIRTNALNFMWNIIFRNSELAATDTEQIFYILNCERELENVLMMHSLSQRCYRNLVDIGCNYGQFVNASGGQFEEVICFDANEAAAAYAKKTYKHDNATFHNYAIVDSAEEKETVSLRIPPGNTGKASIIETDQTDFREIEVPAKPVTTALEKFSKFSAETMIKIDVEGLEEKLVHDLLHSEFNGAGFAFEVLTRDAKISLSKIFEEYKEYHHYVCRYAFQSNSSYMISNIFGVMKSIITGRSHIVIYRADTISEFPFDFIPLVFSIPSSRKIQLKDLGIKNA